jgi:hypothetical protein
MINWISVEERLPDDNRDVLVCIKDNHGCLYQIGSLNSEKNMLLMMGFYPLSNATHWAEINEPEGKK